MSSPLLETKINGASHVIINISGDISLMDANDAASYVRELTGEDANIVFGAKYDETMTDEAVITVIATGLEEAKPYPRPVMPKYTYDSQTARSSFANAAATPTQATNFESVGAHAQTGFDKTIPSPSTVGNTEAQKIFQSNMSSKPVLPTGREKEKHIEIPEFLRNTRR